MSDSGISQAAPVALVPSAQSPDRSGAEGASRLGVKIAAQRTESFSFRHGGRRPANQGLRCRIGQKAWGGLPATTTEPEAADQP
jgi:hypothetical protein